ncbi:MAG: hypothetical protein WBQ94_03765 [Terracidiphilus sp.]
MKRLALLFVVICGIAQAQTNVAAYVYNSSTFAWTPLAASSGTAVQFVPSTAVQLYGQLSSGAWTPCLTSGNCGSGSGGGDTITSPNGTLTVGGTATATTLDVANSLTLSNSNSGASSGTAFNGSAAVTLSANTLGAGSLSNANTWSAVNTFSLNGAASASALNFTGTVYSGGNGTTTFPYIYRNCSGATAVTTFNTAGTDLGFNECSGFTGNFLAGFVNGGGVAFSISSGGSYSGASHISTRTNNTAFMQIANTGTATVSVCNVPSANGLYFSGTYWNGSASTANSLSFIPTCTVGTNGAWTLTLANSAAIPLNFVVSGSIAPASARKGTFVCTAAGTITIANTNELATSDVIISMNTAGGTITTPPAMKTVTAGTGFTVLCGASDTSTYNYDILN